MAERAVLRRLGRSHVHPVLKPSTSRGAFTIIEVLVAIGIIGVLIALIVPALSKTRARALDTLTRANLRTSYTAFATYTSIYDETYPWRPQSGPLIPLNPEGTAAIGPGHFDVSRYWPGLMIEIMPWEEHFKSWLGGGASYDEHPWLIHNGNFMTFRAPSFSLSHSFLARPRLWSPGETDTEQNLRPVRENDVLFPSSKVLLFDREKTHLRSDPEADRDPTLMLFVDGHVGENRVSEARILEDRPWRGPTPLHDTPDGARGRDY